MSTQFESLEEAHRPGFSAHEAPTVAARDLSVLVAACADVGALTKAPPSELPPHRPPPFRPPSDAFIDGELGAEGEAEFWSESPRYSNPGEALESLTPARSPRAIARAVFGFVFVALLVLGEVAFLLAR